MTLPPGGIGPAAPWVDSPAVVQDSCETTHNLRVRPTQSMRRSRDQNSPRTRTCHTFGMDSEVLDDLACEHTQGLLPIATNGEGLMSGRRNQMLDVRLDVTPNRPLLRKGSFHFNDASRVGLGFAVDPSNLSLKCPNLRKPEELDLGNYSQGIRAAREALRPR